MSAIRLGLIGDNIARSQSPRLHITAGRLCGLEVTYEPLIPHDMGLGFEAVFDRCLAEGFRGINVTYPYKELVVRRLSVPDAETANIGACNTVLFGASQPVGLNTDYSGFIKAFRSSFNNSEPGRVAMAGAGGVGRAVCFGLARLGATEIRIYDSDRSKGEGVRSALASSLIDVPVILADSIAEATDGADGLVNCTPLGMNGHPGSAMAPEYMRGARWAFDAVYTPVETLFLDLAVAAGVAVMSGYELFFYQGVDAFHHFTGEHVDAAELRQALAFAQHEKAKV